jgi:hypothetical protein
MVTDIYPIADFGPVISAIAVLVSSGLTLWLGIAGLLRARHRQRLADDGAAMLAKKHAGGTLREGEILLSGVVEHAPDEEVAVRVDIHQTGTETESSGSWSHHWVETTREIIVKPFYLELADGTRVRVLAPPNVEVADALNRKVLVSNHERVMSAELVKGEAIHAHGYLERGEGAVPGKEMGYRDVEREWQLVPANGRMLLSSEPLGQGLAQRARFHRQHAIRALILCGVLQLSFVNYWIRTFGTSEPVKVMNKEIRVEEDSDGDLVNRYFLDLQIGSSLEEAHIDSEDFPKVEVGGEVAIRRGLFGWDVGAGGTLFFMHAVGAVFFALAAVVLYGLFRPASRPWYRRKRVDSTGSGRLPGD